MLEAKAKDQGHKRKCSPPQKRRPSKNFFRQSPKKGLQKIFSGDLQKNDLTKKFSADLQNFNHSKNTAVLEPRTEQFSRT